MAYFTYVLYSSLSDRFYIGSAQDVIQRLQQHNSDKHGWTRTHRPWQIVYTKLYVTRAEAMHHEKELKRFKNKEYLKKVIGFSNSL